MDLQIVMWFQSLGSGFMDVVFGLFYFLLNPLYTMFIPILIYYLFDKRLAYKTTVMYGVSTFFCGTLKEAFGRKRPFTEYPDKVQPRIEERTSSASMPSGHAMGSIGLLYPATKQFGYGEKGAKKRIWVFIVAAFVILMIGFSRPYMGAHYLSDVLVGWGLGILIAIGLDFAMCKLGDKFYLFALLLLPVMILIICLVPDADASGVGLAFTSAMLIGGYLDNKFIKLEINIAWYKRIIRVVIAALGAFILGIALVSKIYEASLGFSLSDLSTYYPIELVKKGIVDPEVIKAKTKAFGTVAYFLMFFAANAWAFIICPCLYKYVPKLWNKIFKKSK